MRTYFKYFVFLIFLSALNSQVYAQDCKIKNHGLVKLTNDDREVLADMADRSGMLEDLTYLLIVGEAFSTAEAAGIKDGQALAESLLNIGAKFVTPGIQDSVKGIMQIDLSLKMQSVQYYLFGHYQIGTKRFSKPIGKRRLFFRELLDMYTCLRSQLQFTPYEKQLYFR